MSPRVTPKCPDWLVEGAEIIVFSATFDLSRIGRLTCTTVKKVSTQTFSVDIANSPRFRIEERPEHKVHEYDLTPQFVLPLDSPEAVVIIERRQQIRLRKAAKMICELYQDEPTRENRLAAIKALQAISDEEGV